MSDENNTPEEPEVSPPNIPELSDDNGFSTLGESDDSEKTILKEDNTEKRDE